MSSIDDIYTSDNLKAADILGREPTVTIAGIEPREFKSTDGRVQKKLVISFRGAQKTFVCNRTNAQRIAYLHGKDYNGWIGKQITLFVDPFVQFGAEIKPAIRVKPPELKSNPNVTTGPAVQGGPPHLSQPAQQVARPSSSEINLPPHDPAAEMDDEIPF